MNDPLNDMSIEDDTPFNLLCYQSLVPLYSPYYFHNHKMIYYNEDQIEIIKQLIIEHFNTNQSCFFDNECQFEHNSEDYLKPRKQLVIQEILNKRVLNTSHEEFIQKQDNHGQTNSDLISFYKNKVYLSQIEDDFQQIVIVINNFILFFSLIKHFLFNIILAAYYWSTIDQFIENDINLDEDDHFTLQKQYKNKYFYNLCLLTGNIVMIPIRLNGCQHLECFDLNSIYRFIAKNKTVNIVCPLCNNEASFLDRSRFYLDKKLIKIINKNTSYQPVWSFVSDEFGLQDILRLNKKLDISKLNQIFWKSKKHDIYNKYINQYYNNFVGQFIINCCQNSSYPIPVRCTSCMDLTKYCDLAQQLLLPEKCLCCNSPLPSNNEEFLNQIRIDFILLKEIQKYIEWDIQTFIVVQGASQDSFVLQPHYQLLLNKIQKVSDESYVKNSQVIRKDLTTGLRINGIPVRWKDCNHTDCIDFYKHSVEGVPRYCKKCQKTYKLADLVWDEVIFNSLYQSFDGDILIYNQSTKTYSASDIELSQSTQLHLMSNLNNNPQNNYQPKPNTNNPLINNFMDVSPQTNNNLKQLPQSQDLNQQLKQVPNFQNQIQNQPNQQWIGNQQDQNGVHKATFQNYPQNSQQQFQAISCQNFQFQRTDLDQPMPVSPYNQLNYQNSMNVNNQYSQNFYSQQQYQFQQQQYQQQNTQNNYQHFTLGQQQQPAQNNISQQPPNLPQQQTWQQQIQNQPQVQNFSFQQFQPLNQGQASQPQVNLNPNQYDEQADMSLYQQSQVISQIDFPIQNNLNANNQFQTAQFNQIQNQMINPYQIQVQISEPLQNQISSPLQNQISQPLQNQISQPFPNQISQPLPNQISQPLPNQISQPLPNQISQPLPNQISQPLPNQISQPQQNQILNPFIPNYYKINPQFQPFANSLRQVEQRNIYMPNNFQSNTFLQQEPFTNRAFNQPQQQQQQQNQQQAQQNPQNQIKEVNTTAGKRIVFKQISKN
ncbi:hypothetical protein ABPG74_012397 [Tetrahymena malaccensis]